MPTELALSRDQQGLYPPSAEVAGAAHEIFPEAVLDQIAQGSMGIPRLINTICDNVLLEGFLRKRDVLDADLVKDVTRDLGLTG